MFFSFVWSSRIRVQRLLCVGELKFRNVQPLGNSSEVTNCWSAVWLSYRPEREVFIKLEVTEEELEKPSWQLPETLPVDGDWFWWVALWAPKPQLGIERTGSDRQIQEIDVWMTRSSALIIGVRPLPLRKCQHCIWMKGLRNGIGERVLLLTFAWCEYHCLLHNAHLRCECTTQRLL